MFCFLGFHGDAAQLPTFSPQLSGRHPGYTPPLSQSDPKLTSRRIDRMYPCIAIQ
jgi:hypothetical protein